MIFRALFQCILRIEGRQPMIVINSIPLVKKLVEGANSLDLFTEQLILHTGHWVLLLVLNYRYRTTYKIRNNEYELFI